MDALWRKADELSRTGRWQEACELWRSLAETARAAGQDARAREAASRAADAARRDDRPEAALAALRLVRDIGPDTPFDQVQYAAVCLDAGRAREAVEVARAAAAAALPPGEKALALDTLAGACLVRGDAEGAREALAALGALSFEGAQLARLFRGAQLDRRDGQLQAADEAWAKVVEALEPFHAAAPGEAAARDERAELALQRAALARGLGRPDAAWLEIAESNADAAAECWRRAHRRSGAMRNELLLARVALARGEAFPVDLPRHLRSWAEQRGMRLLAAEAAAWAAFVRGDVPVPVPELAEEAPLLHLPALLAAAEAGWLPEGERRALLRLTEQDLPSRARLLFVIGASDPGARAEAEHLATAAFTTVYA